VDLVDGRINALMHNYILSRNPKADWEEIENAIDRVETIKSIVRQACIDIVQGEIETMLMRNAMADAEESPIQVPIAFISGVMHAKDILAGGNSVSDYGYQ